VQQFPQALGQVRASEERDWLDVLRRPLTGGDEVQVGGELGRVVFTTRYVVVRAYDIAPRLEPRTGHARHRGGLDDLAGLLLVLRPLVVEADLPHLVGLRDRAGGGEQPLHRVERAVGVIGAEGRPGRVARGSGRGDSSTCRGAR